MIEIFVENPRKEAKPLESACRQEIPQMEIGRMP